MSAGTMNEADSRVMVATTVIVKEMVASGMLKSLEDVIDAIDKIKAAVG